MSLQHAKRRGQRAWTASAILLAAFVWGIDSGAQPSHDSFESVYLDFTPYPDGEPWSQGIALEGAPGTDRNPYYRESLRLLSRGSMLEMSFTVHGSPRDATLTLRHLSSAAESAYNGGWSPVSVFLNGRTVFSDHSPDSHGLINETWDVDGMLCPGRNTLLIRAEELQTHYWVQRIEVSWLGSGMGHGPAHGHGPSPGCRPVHGHGPVSRHLDFSAVPDGPVEADGMALDTTDGVDTNPYYKHSLRLLFPGSHVEASFQAGPGEACRELTLRHLASASSNARNGGWSPVSVFINGQAVASAHSPDAHGFIEETWDIAGLVQPGRNTVRIEAGELETHYWLQRIEVR